MLSKLIVSTILLSTLTRAHISSFKNQETLLVTVKDKESYIRNMKFLQVNGIDILGVDIKNGIIDLNITKEEMTKLNKEKISFEIQDQKSLFAKVDERYLNPDEVKDILFKIHEKYPEITKLHNAGKTLEGRDIWAIKISDNAQSEESSEPSILFNGMHHSREVMTAEVTTDIVEYLTSNYEKNEDVTKWVNNNQIWVLPMLNLDGNTRVWEGDNMWRKNARGGYGVDINRNYPASWGECNGSSGWKSSQTYRGDAPASEPETNVLMNFVSQIKPVFNISYHAYSELVIYPKGCKGQRTDNPTVVEGIGKEIGKILNYIPGTSWETLYSVDGSDIDWMYEAHQVIPYVIEVSPRADGFQPSYSKRDETVKKNRAGWQLLLNKLETSRVSGTALANETLTITGSDLSKNKINFKYKVKRDGVFHIILNNGNYSISNESGTKEFDIELKSENKNLKF